jgi:hypothetical protein
MKLLIIGFVAVLTILCAGPVPTAHARAPQINAGYCPQGTEPRPGVGAIRGKVADPSKDCVPTKTASAKTKK